MSTLISYTDNKERARLLASSGQLDRLRLVDTSMLTVKDAREYGRWAFCCAVETGNLDAVKWLVEKFGLTAIDVRADDNHALRWGIVYGNLEVVQWLVEEFGLTTEDARADDNHALRYGIEEGQLGAVEWLVERFGLTAEDARADDNYAFREGFNTGDLEAVQWLVERFELTAEDIRLENHWILGHSNNGRQPLEEDHLETIGWVCNWFRELWDHLKQLKEQRVISTEVYESILVYQKHPLVKRAIR